MPVARAGMIYNQVAHMRKKSRQTELPADENEPTLTISPEKVCFIIDAKDEVTEPDPGSNPSDDQDAAVLEDLS
jgi:hypothetical protein